MKKLKTGENDKDNLMPWQFDDLIVKSFTGHKFGLISYLYTVFESYQGKEFSSSFFLFYRFSCSNYSLKFEVAE